MTTDSHANALASRPCQEEIVPLLFRPVAASCRLTSARELRGPAARKRASSFEPAVDASGLAS